MRLPIVYLSIVFVMILWGFNIVAIKIIVEEFPAITITSLRIFVAAIVVWVALLFQKSIRLPTKKEFLFILLATSTGVVGHHYFLSVGLTQTTATNTGLILGTVPLATAILAAVILKEKLTSLRIIGLMIGVTGVTITILHNSSDAFSVNRGDVYIALVVIFQALSFIFIKKTSDTMKASLITGYMFLIGSFVLFLISLVIEPNSLHLLKGGSTTAWVAFFLSGVFATGIGHYLYNNAIPRIGPGKVSIFMNMPPFFSLLGASIFLNEQILLTQILAFILIVLSVILGSGMGDRFILNRKKKMNLR